MLNRACQEFSRWNDGADLYLSVNVSPLQLLDPAFAQSAVATLSRPGLRADQLVLEVTETAPAEESEITPVLSLLRDSDRQAPQGTRDPFPGSRIGW